MEYDHLVFMYSYALCLEVEIHFTHLVVGPVRAWSAKLVRLCASREKHAESHRTINRPNDSFVVALSPEQKKINGFASSGSFLTHSPSAPVIPHSRSPVTWVHGTERMLFQDLS